MPRNSVLAHRVQATDPILKLTRNSIEFRPNSTVFLALFLSHILGKDSDTPCVRGRRGACSRKQAADVTEK